MDDLVDKLRKVSGSPSVCANCGLALKDNETYICEPCRQTFRHYAELETAERIREEDWE